MRALWILSAVVLINAGCATPPATSDGLVAARSSMLDELYLRPSADVSSYRRVIIEAVPVQFRADYLSQSHGSNYLLAQPMYKPYQDADSVARDMAGLMQASVADAFRAANYEVVATPGPGVLRVSAKISELFINAPDRLSSSVRSTFNRDAGQATLSLEASDSVSGNVLARVVHRNIVREVSRFNMADDSSNRFWFETAFSRWAANVVAEFGAARRTEVSLAR
jgi:hypothetical protein